MSAIGFLVALKVHLASVPHREHGGSPNVMNQCHSCYSGVAVAPGSPSSSSLSMPGTAQPLKPAGVYESISLSVSNVVVPKA